MDKHQENTDKGAERPEAETLESLFRHVTARQRPPVEDEESIRAALQLEWRAMTGRRRWRRATAGFAVAASVVVAGFLGVGLLNGPETPTGIDIKAVVKVHQGQAWKVTPGNIDSTVSLTGSPLSTGETIVTDGNGLVSIDWVNGESLRLNSGTQLKLVSDSRLELISGEIYIDSDPIPVAPGLNQQLQEAAGQSLQLATPSGTVRHIGTQYMTRVDQWPAGVSVTVSVREGRVALARNRHADATGAKAETMMETVVHSGQKALVRQNDKMSITSTATHGPEWAWVELMAPAFVMDGRSLADLLDWVASETGREVHYRSGTARRMAADTSLHGSMDLVPMRALELVITTSDMTYELDDEMIRIAVR